MSGAGPGSPWGGDGVAGAPPLTRLPTQHAGNHEPGFSKRMPLQRGVIGNSLDSELRASSCLRGCRERRLACGGAASVGQRGVWVLTKPSPQHPLCQGWARTPHPKTLARAQSLPGHLVNPRGTDFTLSHGVRSSPFPTLLARLRRVDRRGSRRAAHPCAARSQPGIGGTILDGGGRGARSIGRRSRGRRWAVRPRGWRACGVSGSGAPETAARKRRKHARPAVRRPGRRRRAVRRSRGRPAR